MPQGKWETYSWTGTADENGEIAVSIPKGVDLRGVKLIVGESDDQHGLPELKPLERGIMISPDNFSLFGEAIEYSLSPELLRQYLLFWDRIDCFVSVFPKWNSELQSPGLDLLESEGLFRKVHVNSFGPGDPVNHSRSAQQTFYSMEASESWVLGGCDSGFVENPNHPLVEVSELDLELLNAIELPSRDIHVESILEFKRKRSAELIRLRMELASLRDSILRSATPVMARNMALKRVADSVESLNQCMSESFKDRVTRSLSVNINASTLLEVGKTAFIAGSLTGSPLAGVLAGFIEFGAGAVQLTIQRKRKPDLPVEFKDYHYAFQAQNFLRGR